MTTKYEIEEKDLEKEKEESCEKLIIHNLSSRIFQPPTIDLTRMQRAFDTATEIRVEWTNYENAFRVQPPQHYGAIYSYNSPISL